MLVLMLMISCKAKRAAQEGDGPTRPTTVASNGAGAASSSATSGSVGPVVPTPRGKPLRESLAADASGKAVLFALDTKGELIARSVDGAFTHVLAPGPYGDAVADAGRDLIWLRGPTTLDVLDLRGDEVAKTVVTAPNGAIEKLGEHITKPPTWTMDTYVNIMLNTRCSNGAGLRLDWSHDGSGTTTGGESVHVVAKAWFAAEEKRAKRVSPPNFSSLISKPHKVPRDVGTCHSDAKQEYGKATCGRGVPFGSTGLELVIVGATDNCPVNHCQLFDPRTNKYGPVPGTGAEDAETTTCGPFVFDAAGTSYLVQDKVCGPGLACTSVGNLAIGWLDADRTLDAN